MISFQPFEKIRGGFTGRNLSDLTRVGVRVEEFVQLNQVHGNKVLVLSEESDLPSIRGASGDALLSVLPEMAVAIRTADCVPILLAHPGGLIGVVHAGWRGTAAEILPRTLEEIKLRFQLDLAKIYLSFGPSICVNCYEVEAEVIDSFIASGEGVVKKIRSPKFLLNLKEANLRQALSIGVTRSRIELRPECTLCLKDFFYSYRGAASLGQSNFGRNYSWVLREP